MITEDQRQQLSEAIFDLLVNRIYRSLSIAEKTTRIVELYTLAEAIENVFFQYSSDEYLQLLGHRAHLLDTLSSPSIKALRTL